MHKDKGTFSSIKDQGGIVKIKAYILKGNSKLQAVPNDVPYIFVTAFSGSGRFGRHRANHLTYAY